MGVDLTGSHPEMDVAEHEKSYKIFLKGTIIVTTLTALLLLSMFLFLV